MPSDTPIYKDGRQLNVSRRAYEGIYKARGWRLRPPKDTTSPSTDGDQQSNQED